MAWCVVSVSSKKVELVPDFFSKDVGNRNGDGSFQRAHKVDHKFSPFVVIKLHLSLSYYTLVQPPSTLDLCNAFD